MYWNYFKLVDSELSGFIARDYIAKISQIHRIQASRWFHQATAFILDEIKKLGLEGELKQYKSDGKVKYLGHTSPIGWHAVEGTLEVLEPKYQKIADFKEIPTSLITHSNSTPDEGVTASLVYVGKGDKEIYYEGKDVRGKIVLAYGRPREVHRLAIEKFGAVGLILFSRNLNNPDGYPYMSFWPSEEEIPRIKFGFTIPFRIANKLVELLESGKDVKVKAKVKAEFFSGVLEVVTTAIEGSELPDEEILLIAHICHPKPGANDNASGSGLLLEILRTIKTLLDAKKIQLKRTLRFLWVPEFFGTFAYISENKDTIKRVKFGINLDMVGENQELTKSVLTIVDTPLSNYSFIASALEFLIRNAAEKDIQQFGGIEGLPKIRYKLSKYTDGSDHSVFVDSNLKISFTALIQWPDSFYHSSTDDITKVSPTTLKIVGTATTTLAITLANPTLTDAIIFANRLLKSISDNLCELERRAFAAMELINKESARATLKAILHAYHNVIDLYKKSFDDISVYAKDEISSELINHYKDEVSLLAETTLKRIREAMKVKEIDEKQLYTDSEIEKYAKQIVPTRKTFTVFFFNDLQKQLPEERYNWYLQHAEKLSIIKATSDELFNFMDGNKSLFDIYMLLITEFKYIPLDLLVEVVKDLKTYGYISF
ncbi:MAG: DUF4910 domain-containing protein [Candidatus Asgardarchaeia archaeon]